MSLLKRIEQGQSGQGQGSTPSLTPGASGQGGGR